MVKLCIWVSWFLEGADVILRSTERICTRWKTPHPHGIYCACCFGYKWVVFVTWDFANGCYCLVYTGKLCKMKLCKLLLRFVSGVPGARTLTQCYAYAKCIYALSMVYVQNAPGLRYNISLVEVQSTDVDRTLDSVECQLAGWFPLNKCVNSILFGLILHVYMQCDDEYWVQKEVWWRSREPSYPYMIKVVLCHCWCFCWFVAQPDVTCRCTTWVRWFFPAFAETLVVLHCVHRTARTESFPTSTRVSSHHCGSQFPFTRYPPEKVCMRSTWQYRLYILFPRNSTLFPRWAICPNLYIEWYWWLRICCVDWRLHHCECCHGCLLFFLMPLVVLLIRDCRVGRFVATSVWRRIVSGECGVFEWRLIRSTLSI